MLNQLFCLTISAVLIPLMSNSTFARPLSANYQYPELPNSQNNSSTCYMETPDGKTWNLSVLCAKKVRNSEASLAPSLQSVSSPAPTSSLGLRNNTISTKCYFLDNNGRPCNSSN